jgi:hypothetical protein
MNCDERTVLVFLFNELDQQERAKFDEHLLACERCWRAITEDRIGRSSIEDLREVVPPGLADRIRLAIETAPQSSRRVGANRIDRAAVPRGLARRAGAITAAVALVVALVVALPTWLSNRPTPVSSLDITNAVVKLAGGLPSKVSGAPVTHPSPMNAPIAMTLDGVKLSLTYYRVGFGEALVARSDQPFGMPMVGHEVAGGRAWVARIDGLSVYCANGTRSVAIVTSMTLSDATNLADYLRIPT